jgi:heme-degrading monooxygenase HmoA
MGETKPQWWRGYVVIWEFHVRPQMTERFEEAYGSRGVWARFFAQGAGYIATELSRDEKNPARYITLDLWESREAYENFRAQHQAAYKAIDKECESLTESELELGRFARCHEKRKAILRS